MAAKGMADRKMTASFLEEVKEEAGRATEQLLLQAKTEPGDILIVGCSSSEIVGERIGTFSSVETAQAVFEGIYEITQAHGLFLAAQCCEHLNRAVIVEKELMKRDHLTRVNVVPKPKAGGSFGTTAYQRGYPDRYASAACGSTRKNRSETDRKCSSGMCQNTSEVRRRQQGSI